jgi:hypothetical protein
MASRRAPSPTSERNEMFLSDGSQLTTARKAPMPAIGAMTLVQSDREEVVDELAAEDEIDGADADHSEYNSKVHNFADNLTET